LEILNHKKHISKLENSISSIQYSQMRRAIGVRDSFSQNLGKLVEISKGLCPAECYVSRRLSETFAAPL
jgi:hypothetical protein